MKDKNRISKVLANTIISAIIGTIIGIVITHLATDFSGKMESLPNSVILLIAVFVLAVEALVLIRIDNYDEFRAEMMHDLSNPFIKINAEVISDFATSLVKKSKYIRVVGTAKQDILEDEDSRAASKRYLNKLETMLSKDYGSEMGFQYYRVVPKKCTAAFEAHFGKCSQNCQKHPRNKFRVVRMTADFDFSISYQIFDQSDMLIIVDNPTAKDTNKDDNALCYWTQDKETIEIFTKRFDSAWSRTLR